MQYYLEGELKVSIHALTRRATLQLIRPKARAPLFQSTPSRGGRPVFRFINGFGVMVSIHALTRRATA